MIARNINKIGRIQTGDSDAQDFKIETYHNRTVISKGDDFGNPSLGNMIGITWFLAK